MAYLGVPTNVELSPYYQSPLSEGAPAPPNGAWDLGRSPDYICNDRNWFDEFSRVSEYDVHAPDDPETKRDVQGIGHVTLTVVRGFDAEGRPSTHGKVRVRDVLFVPSAPVNILSARPTPSSDPLMVLLQANPTMRRPISGTIRFIEPDTPPVIAFIQKTHWADYNRVWLSPFPNGPQLAKSILPDGVTPKILGCVGTIENFNSATQRDRDVHTQLQLTKGCLDSLNISNAERKLFEEEEAKRLSEEERAWLRSRVCRSWSGFITYLYLQGKPFDHRYEALRAVIGAIKECDKRQTGTKEMLKKTYLRINKTLAKEQGNDECKIEDEAEAAAPPPVDPPTTETAPRKRGFTVSTPDKGGVGRETMRKTRLQDLLGDNTTTSSIKYSDKDPAKIGKAVDETKKDDSYVGTLPPFIPDSGRHERIGDIARGVSAAEETSSPLPDILKLSSIPKGLRKRKRDASGKPPEEDSEDDEQYFIRLPSPGQQDGREAPDSGTTAYIRGPPPPPPPPLPPPRAAVLATFRPDLKHPELFVDLKYPYYYIPELELPWY